MNCPGAKKCGRGPEEGRAGCWHFQSGHEEVEGCKLKCPTTDSVPCWKASQEAEILSESVDKAEVKGELSLDADWPVREAREK